jgi:capsular polysaccharide biosynthesis protein
MNNLDLSPLDTLRKALRLWWLIALLSITGGLLGWIFTRFEPPRYEAAATISVGLRQKELVPEDELSMTYVMQEQYLSPIVMLFYSDEVENKLVAQAEERGFDLRHEDFNSQDFRIERLYSRWQVIVQARDPQKAAGLANLWVDNFYAVLADANSHAINAEQARVEAMLIQRCLEKNEFAQANACAGTSFNTLAEMESFLADLDTRFSSEQLASRGVTYALDYSIVEYASVPPSPVLYNKSLIIFAGVTIGLVLGIVFSTSLPQVEKKRYGQPEE